MKTKKKITLFLTEHSDDEDWWWGVLRERRDAERIPSPPSDTKSTSCFIFHHNKKKDYFFNEPCKLLMSFLINTLKSTDSQKQGSSWQYVCHCRRGWSLKHPGSPGPTDQASLWAEPWSPAEIFPGLYPFVSSETTHNWFVSHHTVMCYIRSL